MTRLPRVIRQEGSDVLLAVHVQPRASHNQLLVVSSAGQRSSPERILIRLTAPPVGGAANAACTAFVAELLGLPRSRVVILRGETARHKLLRITNADVSAVLARLQSPT